MRFPICLFLFFNFLLFSSYTVCCIKYFHLLFPLNTIYRHKVIVGQIWQILKLPLFSLITSTAKLSVSGSYVLIISGKTKRLLWKVESFINRLIKKLKFSFFIFLRTHLVLIECISLLWFLFPLTSTLPWYPLNKLDIKRIIIIYSLFLCFNSSENNYCKYIEYLNQTAESSTGRLKSVDGVGSIQKMTETMNRLR